MQGDAPFIGRSHRTLLIFRRDTREFARGKEIELRHQRSPDVEVQIVNTAAGEDAAVAALVCSSVSASADTASPAPFAPRQTGGC